MLVHTVGDYGHGIAFGSPAAHPDSPGARRSRHLHKVGTSSSPFARAGETLGPSDQVGRAGADIHASRIRPRTMKKRALLQINDRALVDQLSEDVAADLGTS